MELRRSGEPKVLVRLSARINFTRIAPALYSQDSSDGGREQYPRKNLGPIWVR